MKELSVEEKARRYDEAIERARKINSGEGVETSPNWTICEVIFPELKKESEDERIRKGLLYVIEHHSTLPTEEAEEYIAWLEKQGKKELANSAKTCKNEQKSVDNIEPKFRNEEWIVWQGNYYKVTDNGCGYELINQNGLSTSLEYGTVDDNAHLWDITKDAKDGDVLAVTMYPEGTWIGIFKEQNGCTFSSHCFLNTEGTFKKGTYNHGNGKAINPATKEQRDFLFLKMKEAGYKWDAEKKQLNKIEQNPADKVELFNKYEGLTDFERTLADICIGWIGEEHGWKQYIKDNVDVLLKIAIKKFNSVQDVPFEQKPAWSEEDDYNAERLLCLLTNQQDNYPQLSCDFQDIEGIKDWVKSLKDRYTWKPNDSQMTALNYVVNIMASGEKPIENDYYYNVFKDLREQLKKLKE